jgi:hypothetical protein
MNFPASFLLLEEYIFYIERKYIILILYGISLEYIFYIEKKYIIWYFPFIRTIVIKFNVIKMFELLWPRLNWINQTLL